ncbi:MAG: ferredoxin [Sphingobium sp.]
MKVCISRDLCCGAQTCVEVAPDVYSLNDEGFNALVDAEDACGLIKDGLEDQAREGAEACPERALKIVE